MKQKKNGKIKFVLFVLVVIFAILVIRAVADVAGVGGNGDAVYVETPQGATLKEIAQELKEKGIVTYPTLFYLCVRNEAMEFKYGGHVFSTDMSYSEISERLKENGETQKVKVVIPEGYELRLIAEACSEAGLCDEDEFMETAVNGDFDYDFIVEKPGVAYRLEGFLFPATYEFEYETSAYVIIDTMLKAFDKVYTDEYSRRAKELGMTDFQVITLASVIEREAATEQEHKKVAGVFYNRLEDGMRLESCATVQYILRERKPVLAVSDTKINSPYNTYANAGLPVGPIASPGKSAIEAALYPESHGYYFFVAKADGSGHIFSKTFEEHQRATAQNQ